MEYKNTKCPCCKKNIKIPISDAIIGLDYSYSSLINATEGFFNLVNLCPECGFVAFYDNGINEDMRRCVASEAYQNILHDETIESGLRNWILLAILNEADENYSEAAIAYLKAYDYLILKSMEPDSRLIKKAASCFLSAADEYSSFADAILAVDCLRRDGDFDNAYEFLNTICNTFQGEIVDKHASRERFWMEMNDRTKRLLDV